jgi:hypothetical protein
MLIAQLAKGDAVNVRNPEGFSFCPVIYEE